MVAKILFSFLTTILIFSNARAEEVPEGIVHEPRAEIYLGFGTSKDAGSIYADGTINHYTELGLRFWRPAFSPLCKYRGFFEFSVMGMNKKQVAESHFPFVTGTDASVSLFSFIPNIAIVSNEHWNGFIGVGPALISIQDGDNNNQQTYGSFVWQGGVIYEFNENWNFGIKTQWTKISQRVSGQKYFQEFWNTNWFFSYAPNWFNGRR